MKGTAFMDTKVKERKLTTADLAAAGRKPSAAAGSDRDFEESAPEEVRQSRLEPLFQADMADDFRARWTAVQASFVDDPRQAVRQGDELVAQVMKNLADTFAQERSRLEAQLDQGEKASTEDLRVALRRYRSFFERLLAL